MAMADDQTRFPAVINTDVCRTRAAHSPSSTSDHHLPAAAGSNVNGQSQISTNYGHGIEPLIFGGPISEAAAENGQSYNGEDTKKVDKAVLLSSAATDLVVCFGEMLIDFVPTLNGYSLADAPSFKKAPGGAPANVAVAIARLGGHSAFIGKVGDDEFGHMLEGILTHHGVESKGVKFDTNARTALAFVTLRHDGEREFMFYRNPSADMLLEESELDMDLLTRASIFHFGSISLIAEPCRSTHLAAMKSARRSGALLSYDPNLRLPLWSSPEEARKGILSIWNEADLIKVSEDEVAFLTNGGDPYDDSVVMKLWHPGLKLLLVTQGQEGCRYYTEHFRGHVPAFKVSSIDTTGAGDAFVGGMLSQLVSDMSLYKDEARLQEALRFANACGAITTTERGAIPALPDKDTVLRLITATEGEKKLPKVPSWQNISQWRSRQPTNSTTEDQ